jgi:hypothetical protein
LIISCEDFGDISIEAGHTIHLLGLGRSSWGHNISIVAFFAMARMVIKKVSPPTSTGFWGHWEKRMGGIRATTHCFIITGLEETVHKQAGIPQANSCKPQGNLDSGL